MPSPATQQMSLEVGCFCVRGAGQSWFISRLLIGSVVTVWLYHDSITGKIGWLHHQFTSVTAVFWRVYQNNLIGRHEDAQDAAAHIWMVSDSLKKECYWLYVFCCNLLLDLGELPPLMFLVLWQSVLMNNSSWWYWLPTSYTPTFAY